MYVNIIRNFKQYHNDISSNDVFQQMTLTKLSIAIPFDERTLEHHVCSLTTTLKSNKTAWCRVLNSV